jgi:hypothetical protein
MRPAAGAPGDPGGRSADTVAVPRDEIRGHGGRAPARARAGAVWLSIPRCSEPC